MKSITILGIYVADLAFFGDSIPNPGETILGKNYVIGPGGKGSNQAVAAAKAGAKTYFISKIGDDQFGSMAKSIYEEAGVDYSKVIISNKYIQHNVKHILSLHYFAFLWINFVTVAEKKKFFIQTLEFP